MHEPCASRGNCYHARAGRVGRRNQPHETRVENGRKAVESGQLARASKKAQETWNGSPENRACLAHGRKKLQETWLNTPEHMEHLARLNNSPEQKAHLARLHATWTITAKREAQLTRLHSTFLGSAENLAHLTRARKLRLGLRPTWPECRFYGLVFGNSFLSAGFTAQQSDGHGVYDGAWPARKIVAELDGSGHHAFRNRRQEDEFKDAARRADGFLILRETDENVLFLKALAVCGAGEE